MIAAAPDRYQFPIRPVDEQDILQNRAIGLIKGRYLPSNKTLCQGVLVSEDGTLIDAVVLGKVKSLLRKIDFANRDHRFVVYPKTNVPNQKKPPLPDKPPKPPLHVQIAGIWEPEIFQPDNKDATPLPLGIKDHPNYFSVRGAVSFQNQEEKWLMVKVFQKAKDPGGKASYNKIRIEGAVEEKAVNAFWEFDCIREGEKLVLKEAKLIRRFKPKPPKGKGSPKGKFVKDGKKSPFIKNNNSASVAVPPARPTTPKKPAPPIKKPIKKQG